MTHFGLNFIKYGPKNARTVTVALLGALCVWGSDPAKAAEPVALVIETEGGVSVEAFSEILEGQTVELASGATMRFTIYAACEEVNVRSGRVTFMRSNFRINAGRVLSRERTECPEVAESGAGAAGGVILRGGGTTIVCRRPGFVLTGPGAAQVDAFAIQGAGFSGAHHKASSRTLTLPDGESFMSRQAYKFQLFSQGTLKSEMELKGNGRPCRETDLTILRVQ